MRKSRFSEQQMVAILREADATSVAAVAKKHKVSAQTIYSWRKHFGELGRSARLPSPTRGAAPLYEIPFARTATADRHHDTVVQQPDGPSVAWLRHPAAVSERPPTPGFPRVSLCNHKPH